MVVYDAFLFGLHHKFHIEEFPFIFVVLEHRALRVRWHGMNVFPGYLFVNEIGGCGVTSQRFLTVGATWLKSKALQNHWFRVVNADHSGVRFVMGLNDTLHYETMSDWLRKIIKEGLGLIILG